MQETFLYLRTKLAMEHDTQTFSDWARAFPFQAMQSATMAERFARDPVPVQVISKPWRNGTIIKFRSRVPPNRIFSQICIFAKYNDNQYEKAAEGIRSAVKGSSSPVFHFRNGKIILVATEEPSRTTAVRCRTYLDKMLRWVITDHSGETLSSELNAWNKTYLSSLSYERT